MRFDYKTASDLACGLNVSSEKISEFVSQARFTSDARDSLGRMLADQKRTIAQQDAEIELLKAALMKSEQ